MNILNKHSLILFIGFMFFACQKNETIVRKEMPFDKYGFTRTTYSDEGFEFLMGNGEMGGRVHYTGLGLEKTWFSDYWKNPEQREFLSGLLLLPHNLSTQIPTKYNSQLNIDQAICVTDAAYSDGSSYHAELIFSFETENLIAMSVENKSAKELSFSVLLPIDGFEVTQSANQITGTNANSLAYNKAAWNLQSNYTIITKGDSIVISIPAKEKLELFYSVSTEYDGKDFVSLSQVAVTKYANFVEAKQQHKDAWQSIRKNIGSVILPDSDYAKWFYRSIYTMYATAGSKKFLAAETMFAYPEVDWDMHAFTYGHGSWAALGFIQLGDSLRAKQSLEWLYQPESLKENIKILIPDTGKLEMRYRGELLENTTYLSNYPPDAFAFGHELTDFGKDIPYKGDVHWDKQFHVNAFAANLFHRYNQYYYDPQFEKDVVTPVINGTASFWNALLKKNTIGYKLPPMLSLSENIMKESVLDAALAAKWNLAISKEYGNTNYYHQAEQVYIPENENLYLEYLHDDQSRAGGGYFGIRASAYLGFPVLEQIKNIDKQKAAHTLDESWKRNNEGKGMISFIANWFALTDAYYGRGNEAFTKSNLTPNLEDKTSTVLYEAFAYDSTDHIRARFNPYFLTGYSSFALVPISMMLQSYDDNVYFFPAMPDHWKDVEFYDLPIEGNYTVSGRYKNANDFEVWIMKNEKLIHHVKNQKQISISVLTN